MKTSLWKKALTGAMAAAMAASLTACGGSATGSTPAPAQAKAEPMTLRLGHVFATSSSGHLSAEKFAELVEERTDGQIKIEVLPNSQAGSDREMFEAMKMGTLDFHIPTPCIIAPFDARFGVFILPFLFDDLEQAEDVMDNCPVVKDIYDDLAKNHGVTIVANWETGFRQFSNTKKEIHTLADIQGLKVRAPQVEQYVETWKYLGVNSTPLAFSELFNALQTGVVDAAEVPLCNFYASGFGEVTKYFAYINYAYDPQELAVSNITWNKLSSEQQEIITKAAEEAGVYCRELLKESEKEYEKELKEKYNMVFTYPDLTDFKDATKPMYDSYAYPDDLKGILEYIAK